MSEQITPYQRLGIKLKDIREHRRETLAEVSGAVEIDEKALRRIEAGNERPSEDILLLLISHFGIQDDKAAELWQLAGYDRLRDRDDSMAGGSKSTMMIMIDPRVMYSDGVEVTANPSGVVLSFQQNGGAEQPLAVSKIGMSHGQAKVLMGVLHQALFELENPRLRKRLPPAKPDDPNKD